MSKFGDELNPWRSAIHLLAAKGERFMPVVTNIQSTIDQNQTIQIQFPNLGEHDVICPGTACLAFNLALTSGTGTADNNRTIVNNIGRAIVSKITINIDSFEIYCLDDADIYMCYKDLWHMTDIQRGNGAYRGIQNTNTGRIRVGAANAVATTQPDASIAAAYGSRFCIPLDFELLTEHMPFYQSGLKSRLTVGLTFNPYGEVVVSTNTTATYVVSDISLEYAVVRNKELADEIFKMYTAPLTLAYTRVQRYTKLSLNKSDTMWVININLTAKSLRGILFLFEDPSAGAMGPSYGRNSEYFYNPLITNVNVTVEGMPNKLYPQGMKPYQHWNEIKRGWLKEYMKDTENSSTNHTNYFQNRYGMWLDFRMSGNEKMHGSGIKLERLSDGMIVQITKTAQAAGTLYCYVYALMDAQLNIEDCRYLTSIY
jgi:hypothetical protein